MNLNQLKYFISVAEHQSFTKAANQFYISQTAITQQIQALEMLLDTPLIDRSTRPISLTPGGHTFLVEAKSILKHMDTAMQRTREASRGLMGTLRIGYTKGYEQSTLPKRLKNFHQTYPNILITCYRNDTDMLASGLLNKEYDLIFTWDSTNIRQESSLEIKVMETIPLYVARKPVQRILPVRCGYGGRPPERRERDGSDAGISPVLPADPEKDSGVPAEGGMRRV